jgi:hypothetical protein
MYGAPRNPATERGLALGRFARILPLFMGQNLSQSDIGFADNREPLRIREIPVNLPSVRGPAFKTSDSKHWEISLAGVRKGNEIYIDL